MLKTANALPLRFGAVHGGQAGTWVTLPAKLAEVPGGDDGVRLVITKPGDLSTLVWEQLPTPGTCDVDVHYSALNFKDVMYSFGKLRLKTPSFGLEFSGIDRVTGKRVMGIGSNCIATKARSSIK